MKTQGEITSLIAAAARPYRAMFDSRVKSINIDKKSKKITLPLPKGIMTDAMADEYLVTVYDAIALARWGDESAVLRDKKGELVDPLAYEVGSRRAQAKAMETWAGDAMLYEREFEKLAADMGHEDLTGLDDQQRRSLAASLIALKSVAEESKAATKLTTSIAPPDIQELVDRVDINAIPKDSKEAADYIRKLLDIELPPNSGSGDGEGEGEGDSGDGEGESSGSGEGEDGEEGGSKAEGKESSPGDKEGEGKGKSPKMERPDPVEKLKPKDHKPGEPAIGADGIGDYVMTPSEHVVVADMIGNKKNQNESAIPSSIRGKIGNVTHVPPPIQTKVDESSLSNHIRSLIQVKMRTRYETGKMSGKVNRRAIHRIMMPTVGDGQWNAQVFRKKSVPKDTTNTAVMVLIDYSGSMINKTNETMVAAGCLSKALVATHVKHCIATFTEYYGTHDDTPGGCHSPLGIGLVKDYDVPQQPEQSLAALQVLRDHQGQNGDADAVAWAYRSLLGRKEKRKVLIVLSDGYPASDRAGNGAAALKQIVSSIEKEGVVEVYGVGMMCDSPRQFYKNHVLCDSMDKVEPALLSLAAGLFDIHES